MGDGGDGPIDAALHAIEQALGTSEATLPEPGGSMPDDYSERLQALADQLAQYDSKAGDTLEQLIANVGDPQAQGQLGEIRKLVSQYDYDAARAYIDELMA